MAASIGGAALHAGADLPMPGENCDCKLEHAEINNLYIHNASLRWVLVDEGSMVADTLLGYFEVQCTSAASQARYAMRSDKTRRLFGGCILSTSGDW